MGRTGRIRRIWTAIASVAALAAAGLAHGAPAQAATYPDAVVLVSGFTTTTPFTNPDPACNGQEGLTWSPPTGVAAALKAAGNSVFTAPVRHLNDPVALPCPASGAPAPPIGTYINSGGDDDANGAALAGFLAFLRDNYGVQRVQLVGHSDGGNWSRSAITQDSAYSGVTVRSLTTLGTPYTGAFTADLAVETQGGKCDFSNPIEQGICDALLDVIDTVFKNMGQTATNQLTHDYLTAWNQRQQIGRCPVTTIAGTFFGIKAIPGFRYYNPSDALVGQASGLAQAADSLTFETIPAPAIPNLQFGGLYPVVHSATLSFLTPKNLLNQPAISSRVASIVAGTPAGAPCNLAAAGAAAADGRGAEAAARQRARRARGPLRLRLPLRLFEVPSASGVLGPPGPEDVIAASPGVSIRCGRDPVPLSALLGDRRLRFGLGAGCDAPLRVAGPGPGRAMLVGSHPDNDVLVAVRGRKVRVSVTGPNAGDPVVTTSARGGKRRLDLDADGRGKLRANGRDTTLRIVTTTQPGSRRATATVVIPG